MNLTATPLLHSLSSPRFARFCTAPNSAFSQKLTILLILVFFRQHFEQPWSSFLGNVIKFCKLLATYWPIVYTNSTRFYTNFLSCQFSHRLFLVFDIFVMFLNMNYIIYYVSICSYMLILVLCQNPDFAGAGRRPSWEPA